MDHTNRFSRVLISFLSESEPYLHGLISFSVNFMSLQVIDENSAKYLEVSTTAQMMSKAIEMHCDHLLFIILAYFRQMDSIRR